MYTHNSNCVRNEVGWISLFTVTICACADKDHSDQDCEIIINLKYWMRRHEFMCALVAYWNVHGKAFFSTNLTKAIKYMLLIYRMLRVVTLKSRPPPHSGVGGTACVFLKSPVKGYFSCDKVRPENCKKGGYLTFHPEISLKKGVVFLSLSLWKPEKFKKGVIK